MTRMLLPVSQRLVYLGSAVVIVLLLSTPRALFAQETPPEILDRVLAVMAEVENGDFERAFELVNSAIEAETDPVLLAVLYNTRGDVHDLNGDYYAALEDYAESLRLNPDSAETYYDMGYASYVHGNVERASTWLRRAAQLDIMFQQPVNSLAEDVFEIAITASDAGDNRQALDLVNFALNLHDSPYFLYQVYDEHARLSFEEGDYLGAIGDLDALIELDPLNPYPYSNRGFAYLNMGFSHERFVMPDLYEHVRLAGADADPNVLNTIAELDPNGAFASGLAGNEPAGLLAFQSTRDEATTIYVINADGSDERPFIPIAKPQWVDLIPRWSPDGSAILHTDIDRDAGSVDVMVFDTSTMFIDWTAVEIGQPTELLWSRFVTSDPAVDIGIGWSPDGQQIAFVSTRNSGETGRLDLYVMNADGTGVRQLTNEFQVGERGAWSPDGQSIAIQVLEESETALTAGQLANIYLVDVESGLAKPITHSPVAIYNPTDWMPDSQSILACSNLDGDFDIYELALSGEPIRHITNALGDECLPRLSPDGTRIAFMHVTDAGAHIALMNADGTHWTQLTQTGDNQFPDWAPAAFASSHELPVLPVFIPDAEAPVCELSVLIDANLREGAGTEFQRLGRLTQGALAQADGYTEGADGFGWWHLTSGEWVREDLVDEGDGCAQLPLKDDGGSSG